ncbi:SLC13 family permease [Paenarthrobacter sp. RAF9]
MRLAIIGLILLVAGGVTVATGILPWHEVTVLVDRVAPILAFVVAMTVVTELVSEGGQFAQLMWAPSLAAVVVPLAFIAIVFRRDLRRTYARDSTRPPVLAQSKASQDKTLLLVSAIVLVLLLPALVSGVAIWIPATAAAAILVVAFAVRRPKVLTITLIPWSLLLFTCGLFLVVEAAQYIGASALLGQAAGEGNGFIELLRLAMTGALGSNVVNNLPAYLLAEPLAGTPERMAALLVGVNAGPLVAPWASLATLLWHDRLVRMNVLVKWKGYALLGLIVAPLTIVAAAIRPGNRAREVRRCRYG